MTIEKSRATRFQMLSFPVNETVLARMLFAIVAHTRRELLKYFQGTSLAKQKDNLEIVLDTFFEDALQTSLKYFRVFNRGLTEKEFLDGFLLLDDWNKDWSYPTIYDIVLDIVEQKQKYHFSVGIGPSKDAWLSLLSEKMKWPKDRLAPQSFLLNKNLRVWFPFASKEELNSLLESKEKYLQVGKLKLPERLYDDEVTGYESYIEPIAS